MSPPPSSSDPSFESRPPSESEPDSGQYFAATPRSASSPLTVTVHVSDDSFELTTDTGVFSHGALDTGTALLLNRAPRADTPMAGRDLLDLGCGSGAIAMTLARRHPDATVWAVDVNERARDLCANNARRLGLPQVRVVDPDAMPPAVTFAEIWSNPPIRIGKDPLHELLKRWLSRLAEDGRAVLVVQRHLGADSLAVWLDSQGWSTRRIGSSKGYRLLEVTPGADRPRP